MNLPGLFAGALLAGILTAFFWRPDVRRKTWPGQWQRYAAAAAAGLAAALAACTVFRDRWTVYEGIYAAGLLAAAACAGTDLLQSFRRKEPLLRADVFLRTGCAVCVMTAVYSALTLGQTVITADGATAVLLPHSQVANGSLFPEQWNYANGDIWALCIGTFTTPFTLILTNQPLARALGSVSCFLSAAAGIWYLSRRIFKNNSWMLILPMFAVFFNSTEIRYQILYEAGYTMLMTLMTVCPALLLLYQRNGKKRYAVLFGILAFLSALGGTRYLAEQTLPLTCGFLLVYLIHEGSEKDSLRLPDRRTVSSLLWIVIPTLAGYGIYKWLCSWHNMNNTVNNAMVFVLTLEECWNNAITFFLNYARDLGYSPLFPMISLYGFQNVVTLSFAFMIGLLIPVLQARRFRQENREIQIILAFALMHNLIMFIMVTFCGLTYSRYTITSICMSMLISGRYVYEYWLKGKSIVSRCLSALFIAASLLECIVIVIAGTGWNETLAVKRGLQEELGARGVEKAYASYWNAYDKEVYSDGQIRYGGINIGENEVSPFLWLVDNGVYTPEEGRSAILLTEDEYNRLGGMRAALFGREADSLEAEQPENSTIRAEHLHIYIYDHDIAADFTRGVEDGVLRPAELTGSGKTALEDGRWTLWEEGVISGSGVALSAGRYRITWEGSGLENADGSLLSATDPEAIVTENEIRGEDALSVELILNRDISDLEVRLSCPQREEPLSSGITLEAVRIEKEGTP